MICRTLLLFILQSAFIFASSGNGVGVLLTSPYLVETESGNIVTASFLVSNQSGQDSYFIAHATLPEGCIEVFPVDTPFFLASGEESLRIVTIKIPPYYPPGTYTIDYVVQSSDTPSCLGVATYLVNILPKVGLNAFLQKVPRYLLAGESYELSFRVVNTGSISLSTFIEVDETIGFPFEILPAEFIIEPQQSKDVVVRVHTDKDAPHLKHLVRIRIESREQICCSPELVAEVEIFPILEERPPFFCYLPCETTFGYGMRNGKKQLFIETAGGGVLDQERGQEVDFLLRLPFVQQTDVYREMGGIPAKGFFHYTDPCADLYLGQGLYALTPLTMLSRFGTGGQLVVFPPKLALGAVFVKDTSSIAQSEGGGFISFIPHPSYILSGSLLRTDLQKESAIILQAPKAAYTGSVRGQILNEEQGFCDLEYASGGAPIDKQACYLLAQGRSFRDTAYGLQLIHAGPQFSGYYRDLEQCNASLGFPLYEALRGNVSYNLFKTNLDQSVVKNEATRSHSSSFGLSYSFPWEMYSSFFYNNVHSTEVFSQEGYKTHFFSLNCSQPYLWGVFQTLVEQGSYRSIGALEGHKWQNYQFYAYLSPLPFQQYALYAKWGNTTLSSAIAWTKTYGCAFLWNYFENFFSQITYEYTHQKNNFYSHYLNGSLIYTFPNAHRIEAAMHSIHTSNQERNQEFLICYTIPWGMPIKRNRQVGGLRGKICMEGGSSESFSRFIVNCNEKRVLTNAEGEFYFPQLSPGNYAVWLEERPEALLPTQPFPAPLQVKGGEITKVDIYLAPSATLSGRVDLYAFDESDSILNLEGVVDEELQKKEYRYKKVRGWGEAILRMYCEETRQYLETMTNSRGEFSFNEITPGKWKLTIDVINLPPYHGVETEELFFTLSPKEEKKVHLRLLPFIRSFKMIDKGVIE